jgi:hypothetical protein
MRGGQEFLGIGAATVILESTAEAIRVGFERVCLRADLADTLFTASLPMHRRCFVRHGNSFEFTSAESDSRDGTEFPRGENY